MQNKNSYLITTQAFSADTIAKAFEEGKISGEIKSQYFQRFSIYLLTGF